MAASKKARAEKKQAFSEPRKMTKQQAVERVLQELGWETSAAQVQEQVKSRYDLDMTIQHIHVAKGKARKKLGTNGAHPSVGKASGRGRPRAASKEPEILLRDLMVVKELVNRLGAGRLRTLLNVLDR